MQAFISNELNFGLQISSDRPHWYGHNIKRLFEKAPDIDVELNKSKEEYFAMAKTYTMKYASGDFDL